MDERPNGLGIGAQVHLDVDPESVLPPASERGGSIVAASVAMMLCGVVLVAWAVAHLLLCCVSGSWVVVGIAANGRSEDLAVGGIMLLVVGLQALFALLPVAFGVNGTWGGRTLYLGGNRGPIRLAALGLPVGTAMMTVSSLAAVVLMLGVGCVLVLPAFVAVPLSIAVAVAGVLASGPVDPHAEHDGVP